MNKKELKQAALDDIARSGLTVEDFKKMKLTPCNADEAEAVLGSTFATHGYILPYFDVHGKPIEAMRFRFLGELKNKEKKIVKYSQPKGTNPHLYFPPCIKWKKILTDTSIPLTFTEGEKKAYKACKEGIHTIGLGGVWSFKSKKLRKALIDDFNHIILKDRKVLLCFDNDSQSNPEVMSALRAFAKVLNDNGANVFNKELPFNPYHKIGLDDYLLIHNKYDYDNTPESQFDEITEVDELSNEVAYIREIGKFYIFEDDLFMNRKTLIDTKYGNRLTTKGEDGKSVSIAQLWIQSPKRREHVRLAYDPGQPEVTDNNEYNLWKGWGCVPKKGSIKLFLDVVKMIFNNDKTLITWFLDWVAYPIQNPGAKMLTAVLLQSTEHGTGKSSIGMAIGAMYGSNYQLVDDAQMNKDFNEWAVNKQFILGDEISGKDKRGEADKIKNLITRETVTLEKKWQPQYTVKDCIQYLFTSNHVDALSIEPDDRRVFVYRVLPGSGFTLQTGIALENFRKREGKAHLLNYFINEHKISKSFDHRERPPMTQAKQDLIDHSLTDIERFLVNIKENPDFALAIDGVAIDRDLFSTRQVILLYEMKHPRANVSETAMGKALAKIFGSAYAVRTQSSGPQGLRALRNTDKWAKASHRERQAHYDRSKIALFEAKKRKHKTEG